MFKTRTGSEANLINNSQRYIEQQYKFWGSGGEMQQLEAKQYMVVRPLYSEDSFAEEHEKICRPHKTILDNVKQYFK